MPVIHRPHVDWLAIAPSNALLAAAAIVLLASVFLPRSARRPTGRMAKILFVNPVVLGGGTPYLPALDARIDLKLAETRTFGARVVYLRYQRA